jgi:hypothetical protein
MKPYTYTMFFIVVSALHVSSVFRSSSGAQKLYMQYRYLSNLCVVTASLFESERLKQASGVDGLEQPTHTSGRQQESMTIPKAAHSFISP